MKEKQPKTTKQVCCVNVVNVENQKTKIFNFELQFAYTFNAWVTL